MQAIETTYRGYRFRSRLEARWAVFFDTLGIKWEYEPEGYRLSDGTMYLPDFFLPKFCGDMFVEVKPERVIDEKAQKLADDSGVPVLMACGTPGPMVYDVIQPVRIPMLWPQIGDGCFVDKYLEGGRNADEYRLFWCPGYENADGSIDEFYIGPKVLRAIRAARSARFEHGAVLAL